MRPVVFGFSSVGQSSGEENKSAWSRKRSTDADARSLPICGYYCLPGRRTCGQVECRRAARARARAGAIVRATPTTPGTTRREAPPRELPRSLRRDLEMTGKRKAPAGGVWEDGPPGPHVMDGVVGAYKNRPRQQSPVGLVRLSKRLQVPEHHGGPSGAQSQDLGALKQDANTPQSLDQPRLTPEIWHRASLRASGTNQGIVPHVPPWLGQPPPGSPPTGRRAYRASF